MNFDQIKNLVMFKELVCPISNEKIDSNVSRLTIFISVILVAIFIFTLQPWFLYVAALDYFIRAFGNSQYSPLRFLALKISEIFGWSPKMIDKAPKVFASRLGFLCLLASSGLIIIGQTLASIIIAAMAGSLFLLDASNIICVGCVIYHHLVFPHFKNEKV